METVEKILLTPEQFIKRAICQYPTLFTKNSFEESKFAVLDQLLNVIGNGIRDDEELDECLLVDELPDVSKFQQYLEETIWLGYEKVHSIGAKKLNGEEILIPDGDSITCLESEKHLYPKVKLWYDAKKHTEYVPYPNFDEKYSTVYQTTFSRLGNDWFDAAIWFYKEAKCHLEKYESSYHYAYPCKTERETENRKADQLSYFGERSNEEISRDWEYPYDGDIEKFLVGKWQKEKARIFDFIENTISYLEEMMTIQ